jgi:hypothetical protein
VPFKGSRETAAAMLDDYRYYIERVMPESRRVAFFEQANLEDPDLPEPPRPDWADTPQPHLSPLPVLPTYADGTEDHT